MEGAKDKIVRTKNARTDVDNEPSSLLYIMDKPLITFEFASFTFGFSLSKLETSSRSSVISSVVISFA